MSFVKQHIHGIIGSILFIIGVIILLLLLGFTTPLPLPPEEGILLDFGGGGNIDAGESSSSTSNEQNASTQNSSNTGVNTQDIEDAASMQASNVPNPFNSNSNSDANSESETTNTQQVNSNLTNLLNGTMFGNGDGTGTSGTGLGSGNPGDGTGGDGSGSGPGGYGGDVGGRAVLNGPKPPNQDNMFGEVKLKYNVNADGIVSDISIVSTTCSECNAIAIATLKKWRYEKKPGSGYQSGIVIFQFKQ